MKHAWDGVGPKKDCLIQIEVGDKWYKRTQRTHWVQAQYYVYEYAISRQWEYRLEFPTHESTIYEGGTCFDSQGYLNDSDNGPTTLEIISIVSWAELP